MFRRGFSTINEQKNFSGDINPAFLQIAEVLSVEDGMITAYGLLDIEAGAQVRILASQNNTYYLGVVMNLEKYSLKIIVLANDWFIRPGDLIYKVDSGIKIRTGRQFMGRVIDSLGNPLDKNEIETNVQDDTQEYALIDIKAPGIITRKSVNEPLQTGIKAIDSMIPIGRGQRELVIGDRQTGKTTVAVNTFLMQAIDNASPVQEKTVYCIYVAIGQKLSSVVHLVDLLNTYQTLPYSIIVSAASAEPAALQYLAPYAACRLGEYFRDNKQHCVIVYDDLSKHAVAYRQLSLLLRRPPGREAYPGDVFYLHSRLLERAAKLNETYGNGSLTALPIIETQKGDVSAYIPTNVISITDGQIFLETDLFYNGIRPAVNVGLSVSRVGSSAQNPFLKKVTSSLRFELAQYRAVAALEELSSDLDATTKHQIHRGVRLVELLKQRSYRPLMIEQQIYLLQIIMAGQFDKIDVQAVLPTEQHIIYNLQEEEIGLIDILIEEPELFTYAEWKQYAISQI